MKILAGLTFAVVGVVAAAVLMNVQQTDSSVNFLETSDAAFNRYLAQHGKSYANKDEYVLRRSLYLKAQGEVNAHNSQNGVTWVKALNQFSDMTSIEISRYLGAGRKDENQTPQLTSYPATDLLQQTSQYVDWRSQMNPVRNQGSCGSCWAFAAVATTEGRYAIKYGKQVLLSEQQLIDCTRDCYACDGGWIDRGLNFIRYNGAMSQASYPYMEQLTDCKNNPDYVIARVNDVYGISDAKIVIKDGPIGMYLQAQGEMLSYGSGIFNGVCGQYDHAVTAVGFGNENGVDYWIIRNSWGPTWGEAGHIRIKSGGNCLLTFDSTPAIA